MSRQALTITPHTGVVNNEGILDAILTIVDLLRTIGIDNLNLIAVGNETIALLINPHCALKGTMDRIVHEQARAFLQVAFVARTHDDSLELHNLGRTGTLYQQSGHQSADTAKAI